MRRVWRLIGLLACLCALLPGYSAHAAPAADLAALVSATEPSPRLVGGWLCATEEDLSIAQVAAGQCNFAPATRADLNRGLERRTVWLKLLLDNDSAQPLVRELTIGHPRLERVTLYVADGQGNWQTQRAGTAWPLKTVDQIRALPTFTLQWPPLQQRVVWIRVQSRSAVDLGMALQTPRHSQYLADQATMLQGLAMGCLLLSVIFGAGWYVTLQDRTSLYFAGFMLGELLTELARSGALRLYFWPEDRPYPIEFMTVAAVLSVSQFWLFLHSYVPDLRRLRAIYLLSLLAGAVFLGGAAWALLVDYRDGVRVWSWAVSALIVAMALLLLLGWRRKMRGSSAILAYFGILSGFEFARLIAVLGVIPFTGLQTAIGPWLFVFGSLALLLVVNRNATETQRGLQKAESEGAARLDLMLSMGHELRSPLNAILGHTRLLERLPLQPETRPGLSSIRHNAQHLLSMMDEILDYAQSKSQRLRLQPKPVSWGELTKRLVNDARALAVPDVDRLQLSIEGARETVLLVDERRLLQVCHNLIQNAVRHTGQAVFGLQCTLIPASARAPCRALFEVWDHGPGVAPLDQDRVFEPFGRGKGAHLAHVSGLGMGLAISRQLVRAMGGELLLSSPGGKGCRFSFEIQPPVVTLADLHDMGIEPESVTQPAALIRESPMERHAPLAGAVLTHTKPDEQQVAALLRALDNGQVSELLDQLTRLEQSPDLSAFVQQARQAVTQLDFATLRQMCESSP